MKKLMTIAVASALANGLAFAEDDSAALKQEVEQLKQEVHRLSETQEQMLDQQKQSPAQYGNGFELVSGERTLKIGGYGQFDGRYFESGSPGDSEFTIRRLRPEIRGKIQDNIGYRIQGDFAGSSAKLVEGWMDWQACAYSKLTIGQFKEPFSLEALQSAANLDFLERAMIVTSLAPLFDVGAGASGKVLEGRVEYGLGVFNGRGSNVEDNNDDEDIAARLVVEPLEKIYAGASFTTGEQDESLKDVTYRSAGRVPFVKYADAARTDGNRERWGADIEWIAGPASVKAEWLKATQDNVFIGTTNENADIDGFYVMASYILTGQDKVRNGHPVLEKGEQAWELVARYDEFNTSEGLFDSGLATGTDRAQASTVGLNWYPSENIRVMGNLVHVKYDDEITANGQTADDENVALLRLQYSL